MPGPAPTDKSVLAARGSRLVKDRPDNLTVAAGEPKPTAKLSKFERARWRFYVDLLLPRGAISEADAAALTMLVKIEGQEQKIAEAVEKAICGSTDWKRLYTALQDTRRLLKDMLTKFGMTPADRTRVKVDKPKNSETDGKAKFFKPRIAS